MSDESNPALDALENDDSSNNQNINVKNSSPIADIADALELLLSEENADKKSNISSENEQGLIMVDVLQAHMKKSFNYQFPSLIALKTSKQDNVLSVGGYRSTQIVDVLKSIQTQVISGEIPTRGIKDKILGR
jgi:hypothetical protein